MKSSVVRLLTIVFATVSAIGAKAQQIQSKSVQPLTVEVASIKTTNIVFPYSIVSVDRGSQDVLAQKAKGVENILQVKAARDSFPQTNLSVVTSDGRLHSFTVSYASQPAQTTISLIDQPQNVNIVLSPESINHEQVRTLANISAASKKKIYGMQDHNSGAYLSLNGLFVHDELLYFRVRLQNRTNLNYGIDQLRFYIRDQKKAKRTATQEIEITPVYVHDPIESIEAKTEHITVFALPKFTIPDKKYLVIQLMEQNGGRHMEIKVKNKTLFTAQPINY